MNSFHGKVLAIDVSDWSWQEESIPEAICREFLGGKGLATYLLLSHTPANVQPLSPENALIFAVGPATGVRVLGSCRYGVFTKSPLTGIFCESYSGGDVAEYLSGAGYDAVVIIGASRQPIYLEISNGSVVFRGASHLWGKDTYDAEAAIRAEIGGKRAGISVIGPAGENTVKFASIVNERWRCAGRGGTGAVMGSKKIKAIVFSGNKTRTPAQPELLDALWKRTQDRAKTDKGVASYRKYGTWGMVATTNRIGAFPTRYWSQGSLENWQNVSAEALLTKCKVRSRTCPKCLLACRKIAEVQDGRHQGLLIEGPEYETIYAFGGLCLIEDVREIMHLNDLCDRLGLDTITAGNLAAFTVEASRRKALGVKLEFGDVEEVATIIKQIGSREGIGNVLAEGIQTASREWGLMDLAVHVKGMEPGGYDPRVMKSMGLAYAISDRGACHLRATVYKAELSGTVTPGQVDGIAKVLIDYEDRHTLFDSLILCRFYRDLYPWDELLTIINGLTGLELEKVQAQRLASNITARVREFNMREGMTSLSDGLPERFFQERLGPDQDIVPKASFQRMLSEYYALRGWNQ